MKPKSICLVAPFAEALLSGGQRAGGGGAERQLALIGQVLADRGWVVSFVVGGGGGHAAKGSLVDSSFRMYQARFRYLGGSKRHLVPDLMSLGRALRRSGAGVIGLRSGGLYVLLGLLVYRMFGAKIVVWLQNEADLAPARAKGGYSGIIGRNLSRAYTWLLKRADLLIAQTQTQYEAARRLGAGNVQLVQSISTSLWQPQIGKRGAIQSEGRILWAGNVTPNKRIGLLFDIAERLPEYRFAVATNPGDARLMEESARAAAGLENVRFLGPVAPKEMEQWFERAKLVLNTSVVEGFPNAFLQAWFRGLPVVSAGVDPDGVISKYALGTVVPVKLDDAPGVERLVGEIRRIMTDDSFHQELGQAGLDYVKRHHSPEVIGPQLDKTLLSLLQGR